MGEKECIENNVKLLNIESELNTYKNKYEILINQNTITNNALIDAQNKLRDVHTNQEQNNVEKELSEKLLNRESELNTYKNKYELLVNNSTTINNALIDAQKKLREVNTSLEQKNSELYEMKIKLQKTSKRVQDENQYRIILSSCILLMLLIYLYHYLELSINYIFF